MRCRLTRWDLGVPSEPTDLASHVVSAVGAADDGDRSLRCADLGLERVKGGRGGE